MDKYKIVHLALNEDMGTGDVSAQLLVNKIINAQVVCNEKAVICGLDYFEQSFLQLDDNVQINWTIQAGNWVKSGDILCQIQGSSQAIISGERVALNFLQTLSATATQTRQLVDKIAHTHTQILDTRKTLPNLRIAQKEAVVCGGGVNHRFGLYDAVMLKENHLITLRDICQSIAQAKQKYPHLPIIIEVENLSQLQAVLSCACVVDRVLCDNFDIKMLTQAVALINKTIPLEASGNINEDNILDYAKTGVDYISVGSITKHINAIDLSLKIQ